MADEKAPQPTQREGEETTDALKSYPVEEAQKRETERVKKSEDDGRRTGAYNPDLNPGFRPDVYDPKDHEQAESGEVLTTATTTPLSSILPQQSAGASATQSEATGETGAASGGESGSGGGPAASTTGPTGAGNATQTADTPDE